MQAAVTQRILFGFAPRALIAVPLVLLILATGCVLSKEIKLSESDNDGQVEMEIGQVLAVVLESNPTTGYLWEAEMAEGGILLQVGEPEFKADSKRVGAGGKRTFRFKAVSAGQADLRLVYHRPWEKGKKPEKTFSCRITVR